MKTLYVTMVACMCVSCSSTTLHSQRAVDAQAAVDGPAIESGADVGTQDSGGETCRLSGGSIRIPQEHRAAPQSCPAQRGSISPVDTRQCASTVDISCTSDAECTAGRNGRCLLRGYCESACSYDECLRDTDCPAKQPCDCRSDGTSTIANRCLPDSNCATDADCGQCGFCSPSMERADLECWSTEGCSDASCDAGGGTNVCACVDAVRLTYACHTANDECTDNADCALNYCAYKADTSQWACGSCLPQMHL